MDSDPRAPIAEAIRRLEQLLELMPSGTVKELRGRIATLRATLLESRPPALLLVGREQQGVDLFLPPSGHHVANQVLKIIAIIGS